MPDRIYLDPASPDAGAEIIKVGGQCYHKIGDSDEPYETSSVDDTYDTCNSCAGLAVCGCNAFDVPIAVSGYLWNTAASADEVFSGSSTTYDNMTVASFDFHTTGSLGYDIHISYSSVTCLGDVWTVHANVISTGNHGAVPIYDLVINLDCVEGSIVGAVTVTGLYNDFSGAPGEDHPYSFTFKFG